MLYLFQTFWIGKTSEIGDVGCVFRIICTDANPRRSLCSVMCIARRYSIAWTSSNDMKWNGMLVNFGVLQRSRGVLSLSVIGVTGVVGVVGVVGLENLKGIRDIEGFLLFGCSVV